MNVLNNEIWWKSALLIYMHLNNPTSKITTEFLQGKEYVSYKFLLDRINSYDLSGRSHWHYQCQIASYLLLQLCHSDD